MSISKYTDKQYKLTRGKAPLSFSIASRNSARFPLMWFDEKIGVQRALRYASNQRSPFEDAQDGNAVLAPIVFIDGMLHVPAANQVLQEFLSIHPHNGIKFVEVNHELDARAEVEDLDLEVDALIAARSLSVEMMETVARVLFNVDTSTMTTSELKRDLLVHAKRDPSGFLFVVNDSDLQFNGTIAKFFDHNVITWRGNKKEVYFSTPSNKKRMMVIPFGDDPDVAVAAFFKSDDGLEHFIALEKLVEA